MNFIESIILGLVQGITEFLPVSSSGHLVLAQDILGVETNADLLYDTLLHLGTLFAVFVAFRELIWELIKTFFTSVPQIFKREVTWKTATGKQRMIVFIIVSVIPMILISPFKDKIESLYSSTLVVGIALLVNAVMLFVSDRIVAGKKTAKKMTFLDSIIIGLVQTVAITPGISRSGSTITAGIACGLKRSYAAKYSFILAIPTILGSTILQIFDLFEESIDVTLLPVYLVGMITAAISGFFAIKLLEYLVKSKKFFYFAIYCSIVGIFAIIWSIVA